MALFPNFKTGFSSYGVAHKLIIKHKLWGYVFLPAIINIIVVLLIVFGGWHYIGLFTNWVLDITGLSSTPDGVLKNLVIILKWAVKIILYILLFFLYTSIYRYVVLAILSPALAILSEKTDKIISGHNYPFRFKQFLKDILRGILIVIRNFFIELGFMILLFFVGYVPLIGWASPVIMFFITCYFYGFSMIDYSNERYKLKVRDSVTFVRKNRGMAVANGMVFYFIFFCIPVVGFIVAPAYSVIAATIAVNKVRTEGTEIIKR